MWGHLGLVLNIVNITFYLSEKTERKIPKCVWGEREVIGTGKEWATENELNPLVSDYKEQEPSFLEQFAEMYPGRKWDYKNWKISLKHYVYYILKVKQEHIIKGLRWNSLFTDMLHWFLRNTVLGLAVCVLELPRVISLSKKLRIIGLSDSGVLSSPVNAAPVPFSVHGAAGTWAGLGRFTLVCCTNNTQTWTPWCWIFVVLENNKLEQIFSECVCCGRATHMEVYIIFSIYKKRELFSCMLLPLL